MAQLQVRRPPCPAGYQKKPIDGGAMLPAEAQGRAAGTVPVFTKRRTEYFICRVLMKIYFICFLSLAAASHRVLITRADESSSYQSCIAMKQLGGRCGQTCPLCPLHSGPNLGNKHSSCEMTVSVTLCGKCSLGYQPKTERNFQLNILYVFCQWENFDSLFPSYVPRVECRTE